LPQHPASSGVLLVIIVIVIDIVIAVLVAPLSLWLPRHTPRQVVCLFLIYSYWYIGIGVLF